MIARRIVFSMAMASMTFAVPSLQADLIEQKYNFGADISGTIGLEDYQQGDVAYTAENGFGFTFSNDSNAGQNGSIVFVDRSGGVNPTNQNALAMDQRADAGDNYNVGGGDTSPLYDPFTFRVDLPNGEYHVQVSMGDPTVQLVSVVYVGDAFLANGNTGALDESAGNSIRMVLGSGNFTGPGDFETLPANGPARFEVTNGYLLIGFRRDEGSIRYAGINEILISQVPEPATLGMLGLGVLVLGLRRGDGRCESE